MSEVAQLEAEHAKQMLIAERSRRLARLVKNADFRALITDGFCGVEAIRYIQESGDPMLNDRERADALAMAQASGHLKRFLAMTGVMGDVAERTIKDIDEVLAEARAEEAEAAANPPDDGEI